MVRRSEKLTHFDRHGAAHMVDVGRKSSTHRVAIASGRICMQAGTFRTLAEGRASKGDVLGVARIAAIQAAKRASETIPLAHPIQLTRVGTEFTLDAPHHSVRLHVTVECLGKTGVEMEALCAVAGGLLTVYDMLKAIDRGMTIENVRLEDKRGGKSGTYIRG